LGGAARWLDEAGFKGTEVTEEVRLALWDAREALRDALEHPGREPQALNAVLRKGRMLAQIKVDGPTHTPEVPDAWRVAWLAAQSYLELLSEAPERIRRCAHPNCVLYFYDTSKNGTRRWCSMRTCGNRAKAQRFQQNHHV
jgi:predicted RNA-binding Zn ribbon-like protein